MHNVCLLLPSLMVVDGGIISVYENISLSHPTGVNFAFHFTMLNITFRIYVVLLISIHKLCCNDFYALHFRLNVKRYHRKKIVKYLNLPKVMLYLSLFCVNLALSCSFEILMKQLLILNMILYGWYARPHQAQFEHKTIFWPYMTSLNTKGLNL